MPPALLDAPWLARRKIVMLEPRRIAARAAAAFMARQRGETVGQTVGYRIRFEARVSRATRIEVVTEGILTRMLQDDPGLSGTGAIVFDEFHERYLAGDLGAALALDVQASLPWSDGARRLRVRIAWLQRALPDADLPDVSDAGLLASLETWLAPALAGRRKLGAVTAQALSGAFAARLTWPQGKLLERTAPDAITVPSGMTRRLDYFPAAANDAAPSPVLAMKLQELFGLTETPCVANGHVPVTLHLLSPAGRPIQVTQDLHSFWQHTYPDVRKELKGRYPRHPWPDDPWNAVPTHRPKPRR